MKQKSQNRFLAALLAVAMMLQMLPMLAFAEDALGTGEVLNKRTGTKYTSLATAVEEASSGDTIELGEGSGLTIHRHTFLRDDEAEIVEWDKSNWDGMWQNALGETIVIDSSLMQYIACSPDYSMSGTMNDEGEGMGLYLYDNGTRAYLCPSDDGNSFTLSAERFGRYGDDQHFDGVFYRNADFYTYTDMENAEFYEDEYSTFYIWYYDGVNRYLLGNDYTIGDDGLAYHDEDGLVYPAGWIPEAPYDPADDWGENWMDNWDI